MRNVTDLVKQSMGMVQRMNELSKKYLNGDWINKTIASNKNIDTLSGWDLLNGEAAQQFNRTVSTDEIINKSNRA